jgi:hypothetical protein
MARWRVVCWYRRCVIFFFWCMGRMTRCPPH